MRSLTGLCCALLVALSLGLCLFPARRAAAANFTVNSLADTPDALLSDGVCADAGGACTLRAAIQQANADPIADSVGFSVTGTINLTGALPAISNNLVINGPGTSLLTVRRDTGGEYRVFAVATGVTAGIHGLTVNNGLAPAAFAPGGGGVLNSGTLAMSNCAVNGNATAAAASGTLPPPHGGGIYNEGVLTLSSCNVNNNATGNGGTLNGDTSDGGNGGGIYNIGDLTLTDCNVNGNTTGHGGRVPIGNGLVGGGGHGGGLYNAATLKVSASTFDGNRTGDGADVTDNSNAPSGDGGSGGGIYSTGTAAIVNGVVVRNVTGKGGSRTGINCEIVGNGGNGGGIASPSGSTLKLSQSTVVLNQTGNGGSLLSGGQCTRRGLGGGMSGVGVIRSSIIALNETPRSVTNNNSVIARNMFGTFESRGYNYFGVGGTAATSTDKSGTVFMANTPNNELRLDLTTFIPIQGSPAIDAGLARDVDEQTVTTDRRGAQRPFDFPAVPPQTGGDDSDIGALERQANDPVTTVQFGSATTSAGEGCVEVLITLTRTGPLDLRSEVTYVVNDGTAHQRGDFTRTTGRVVFNPGATTRSLPVLLSEDAYAEGTEELTVTLTSGVEAQIGTPNPATLRIDDNELVDGAANPIDDNATFVGQHYHDFLSRQADSNGRFFWRNELDQCGGDPGCLDRKRVDVSAAFFFSIEFQQTGFFVIRVGKAAFGNQPANPRYLDFLADAQEAGGGVVVGDFNWQENLEINKRRFVERFVQRPEFVAAHGGQNAEQFVDSLFANVGVTPTQAERNAAITAHGNSDRASALRSVAESNSVFNKLYNPAFVLMQYFAYLRRNPDAAPDNNFDGYNFWLSKLDQATLPGEDARNESVALARVRRAEMVRAFLLSAEYRGRFQGDPNRGAP